MEHIAHIRSSDGKIQTIKMHSDGVAELTEKWGAFVGTPSLAKLAGWIHDMGKERREFWEYIQKNQNYGDESIKGKVDHGTAGGKFFFQQYHDNNDYQRITAEILAMITAYHHGGLADFLSPDCESEFKSRMEKDGESLGMDQVEKNYFTHSHSLDECDELFKKATEEIKLYISKMKSGKGGNSSFMLAMLTKYLYSCLIDGDRLDTYLFMEDKELTGAEVWADWSTLIQKLETHLTKFPSSTEIEVLRKEISEKCMKFAERKSGIYKLTVPTGGGKTLSGVRYALHHAERYGKDRIVYIAPFLTIIEQNVKDIKEALALENSEQNILLEFHSNVLQRDETSEEKLISERWESPIIFTTMVQFLETFFGRGTRDIRRLHQLANAVIIFDEVQAIPTHCIHLFNGAVNFLADYANSTVVLCTATQPTLDKVGKPVWIKENPEIIPDVSKLFYQLKRVEIVDARKDKGYSTEEVGEFAWEKAVQEGNALIILNTKASAKKVFRWIEKKNSTLDRKDQFDIFHLSTSMCAGHRSDILGKDTDSNMPTIRGNLQRKQRTICVTTQLIEAGVNISFRCVIRSLAGLDSVAQSAGRCNRHGEEDVKEVYLVNLKDENLDKLTEIRIGQEKTKEILNAFREDPTRYDGDLLSPKATDAYFKKFYFNRDDQMDFPVNKRNRATIVDLLGGNKRAAQAYGNKYGRDFDLKMKHAHKTAAEEFYVIQGGMTSVLVPYGEGEHLIEKINSTDNLEELHELVRRAQRFTVNLFSWQYDFLAKQGAIISLRNGSALALDKRHYMADVGVVLEEEGELDFLFIGDQIT